MALSNESNMVELLQAMQSGDNPIRQKAETLYQTARMDEPESLLIGLVTVLGSISLEESRRKHAAILLRGLVVRGAQRHFAFARMSLHHQREVASELLRQFEYERLPSVQRSIGNVISQLAEHICDKGDPRGALDPGSPTGWAVLLPTVFRMCDSSTAVSLESCESAFRLLRGLVPTISEDILAARPQLGVLLQSSFAHSKASLRAAGLLLVCEIVRVADKASWSPLLATAGALVDILQALRDQQEDELLSEVLQSLIDVATLEPDFFKAQLSCSLEPANFLVGLTRVHDGSVDEGLRCLALEWLVSYVEARSKWLSSRLPAFLALVIEACMELMLDVDDGEEELTVWANLMLDEEGEEGVDQAFHAGEQAIDRAVRSMTMDSAREPLMALAGRLAQRQEWQAKHAALAAMRQTAEFVDDPGDLDQMVNLVLHHLEHPHPRVRYGALHALGQMANDQAPHLQDACYKVIMPVLINKMDDQVDRVASMAMSAFISFGEPLDNSLMLGYAQVLMEKLVKKLQATQHRGVREESITSIAVIAGVMGKDFSDYYDVIMPMLKQFVVHATSERENRLRGKAFECMSLLGIAVGKDKFLPDAQKAVAEMMNTPLEADDVQREYIKEASERICHCLKKDFVIFLPLLLPGMFKSLAFENGTASAPGGGASDEYIQVSTGDGKLVTVHTHKFDEMLQSVQLLHTFVHELEGAFFDWVPSAAEALLPLLSTTDEISPECDAAWSVCLRAWALLINSARVGACQRGAQSELPRTLLNTVLQHVFKVMDKYEDGAVLADVASGIAACVRHVGPGALSDNEAKQLVEKVFELTDKSFARSVECERRRQERRQSEQGLPQELSHQEEDDATWGEDEEACRRRYVEVLGAVMEVAPTQFMGCLPHCASRIGVWVSSTQNRVLALHLACDLIKHLQAQSESAWPVFMPEVLNALGGEDPEAQMAAAYAVNIAAPLASFVEAAPEAFRQLAQLLGRSQPRRRDSPAKLARDHAVAALFSLARAHVGQCPPEVQAWRLVVNGLPLRDDAEEARKVHAVVVDLVLEQHPGLLGGAERAYLGLVLSALAEIYHFEPLSCGETDEKIRRIFSMIPRENLQLLVGNFSEKQRLKIEKMLAG